MILPDLDYTAWRFWIDVAQWAVTLVVLVVVFFQRRDKRLAALETAVKQLSEGCGTHRQRTSALEENHHKIGAGLAGMPTKQDLMALSGQIGALAVQLATAVGRMEGINRAVDLINEHLINKGDGK